MESAAWTSGGGGAAGSSVPGTEGVLCILGLSEEAVPAVLVVMTVGSEVSPNLLYLTLSLAVGLGVISGGQADGDAKKLKEGLPYMRD